MKGCVFCQIVEGKIPAQVVYEDKEILAFKDAKPSAPVHILIIPKIHIDKLSQIGDNEGALLGKILLSAKKIAKEQGIDKSGYKVMINNGKGAGQVVFHLHFHLLGGWKKNKKINLP